MVRRCAASNRRGPPNAFLAASQHATGQALVYVYGRETRADADTAKVLTMDEARRIAANFATLLDLPNPKADRELWSRETIRQITAIVAAGSRIQFR